MHYYLVKLKQGPPTLVMGLPSFDQAVQVVAQRTLDTNWEIVSYFLEPKMIQQQFDAIEPTYNKVYLVCLDDTCMAYRSFAYALLKAEELRRTVKLDQIRVDNRTQLCYTEITVVELPLEGD